MKSKNIVIKASLILGYSFLFWAIIIPTNNDYKFVFTFIAIIFLFICDIIKILKFEHLKEKEE